MEIENSDNTLKPRELHGFRLICYSCGFFAYMFMMLATDSYIFNFYIYTLHLDAVLVTTGSTITMIVGAFSSILFGVIIDNTKPRKIGKRRLYILIALPFWVVSQVLLYYPPLLPPITGSPVIYWPTAIWLWSISLIKSIFGSMMLIAISSVLPEISQTLENRKKAALYGAFFRILASIVGFAFPMIIQSMLADPQNIGRETPSGQFILTFVPPISIIFGILSVFLVLATFFSIDESFHFTLGKPNDFEKRTFKDTFKGMFIPMKDKEYMKYLGVQVSSMSSQITFNFITPFIMFVLGWNLGSNIIRQIFIYYIFISLGTKFVWLYIWKRYSKRQKSLLKGFQLNFALIIVAALLMLCFLIKMDYISRLILFVLSFGTVLGCSYSTNIFSSPLFNEIIDRAAKKFRSSNNNDLNGKSQAVTKISGAYYGLINFSMSITMGVVNFVYGFIFQGDNSTNPIIITILMSSCAIFYIIAFIFLKFIKIKIVA